MDPCLRRGDEELFIGRLSGTARTVLTVIPLLGNDPVTAIVTTMSLDPRPLAIVLMGPTASGKTALACALADQFALGLVSVDSALVYRGLDIGTAKPDADTLRRHPHALVDIRDPTDAYSAADFRADALIAMQRLNDAGKIPLLVGGTGLYFRALERGLSDLPASRPEIRAVISTDAQKIGWPAMHARLAERDAIAAQRIRPSDPQRIQRALEVIAMTGKPLSDQQGQRRPRPPWRFLKLALMVDDRSTLHERIAQRFDAMLKAGFLDEVRGLHQRGDLHAELPAVRAVGYRQAWEYLDGTVDAATFRYRAIAATRQLAKRQITWIRSELDARGFNADDADTGRRIIAAVDDLIGRNPANR